MSKIFISLFAFSIVVLAGCSTTNISSQTTAPVEPDEIVAEQNEAALSPEERELQEQREAEEEAEEPEDLEERSMGKGIGQYAAFSDAVIGNSETSVLFFHAPWCGECKRDQKALTQWYDAKQFNVSTYKIDYDTATELKNRYNVAQQNTYVVIDGEGNALSSVSFPGLKKLEALLSSTSK